MTTDDLLEQALRYHQAGDFQQAEQIYRQILLLNPQECNALNLLGVCALAAGRRQEALDHIARAVALHPTYPPFHNNQGMVYQALGRLAEAAASYRQALRLQPDYALAHSNLSGVLVEQGRYADAAAHGRQALLLRPELTDAYNNLGTALLRQGQLTEAEAAYRQALDRQPNQAGVLGNFGCVLKDQGRLAEAVACFRQALALKPDQAAVHSNLLYSLHYVAGVSPEALFREHCRWAEQHADPLAREIEPHRVPPTPDRPVRIGYVSPDFRQHPVAFFLHPVLAAHDRRRFQVVCYSDVKAPDAWTERLRGCADEWRPILGLSDGQAAERVRADRIDILVDLAGHTANNRLLLFARKPAPIQVTHFGYPNTTGLRAMDYRITDSLADPPGATEHLHTEQLVRLPEVAWCYEASASLEVNPLPAQETGLVTFGSFNYLAKVTPEVVEVWSSLLRTVPGSRLKLLASAAGEGDQQVRAAFAAGGIGAERLEFVGKKPRDEYLRLYNTIDLGLDPFPYNGGVTTCDALWMGIPVVTLAGGAYVARQGVSLLSNVGLADWIAETPEEYVALAARRAADLDNLSRLRAGLRQRLRESPVSDGPRFTRHLEAAYLDMWARWRATAEA